jgi:hypothetical protein
MSENLSKCGVERWNLMPPNFLEKYKRRIKKKELKTKGNRNKNFSNRTHS